MSGPTTAGATLTPPPPVAGPPQVMAHGVAEARSLFDREILFLALGGSLRKLDPRVQVKNPVKGRSLPLELVAVDPPVVLDDGSTF